MLTFPCVGIGEKTWTPSQEEISRWEAAYPALDIPQELRKMEVWILANPQRRKTASGMPRFVVNWLNLSQNKGFAARRFQPAKSSTIPQEPTLDTAKLRLEIEAQVRKEHPDWGFYQVAAECGKRFGEAMKGVDFGGAGEK